jgi:hypothetical protein
MLARFMVQSTDHVEPTSTGSRLRKRVPLMTACDIAAALWRRAYGSVYDKRVCARAAMLSNSKYHRNHKWARPRWAKQDAASVLLALHLVLVLRRS